LLIGVEQKPLVQNKNVGVGKSINNKIERNGTMSEYMLTIKVPFDAFDDLDARKIAIEKMEKMGVPENVEVKLQEFFQNKAPRKIVVRD